MLPQILPKCRRHLKSHSSQRKRPVSNFSWSINVLVGNCEMMLVEILCCLHSSFHFFVSLTFFQSVSHILVSHTHTFTHPHRKLAEQNISVHRLQASTRSLYLTNAWNQFNAAWVYAYIWYNWLWCAHVHREKKKHQRVIKEHIRAPYCILYSTNLSK